MIRRPLILKKAFFYPHFEKYEYVVYRKLVTMLLSADGFCCFFVLFRREVIHKKKSDSYLLSHALIGHHRHIAWPGSSPGPHWAMWARLPRRNRHTHGPHI